MFSPSNNKGYIDYCKRQHISLRREMEPRCSSLCGLHVSRGHQRTVFGAWADINVGLVYMLLATLSLLLSLPPIVFSICNPQSKHCIRIQCNVLQFYLAVYLLDDWHSLKHFIRCTHRGNWYLKVSTQVGLHIMQTGDLVGSDIYIYIYKYIFIYIYIRDGVSTIQMYLSTITFEHA